MCGSLAGKYSNVHYASTDSPGVSKARNIGLSIATGDVISFCDADDYLEKNAVEKAIEQFYSNPSVAVVVGAINTGAYENNHFIKSSRKLKERTIHAAKALRLILVDDSIMGSVCNKYYRRQILKGTKFDPELSLCEDMHFNAVVLSSIGSTYRIKIISTPLYCYVANPASVTHDKDALFDENDELKYISALKRIGKDCDLDRKTIGFLQMKICCFAIDCLEGTELCENRKHNLLSELKKTYMSLLFHLFANNWKWNTKRLIHGLKFLILAKRERAKVKKEQN